MPIDASDYSDLEGGLVRMMNRLKEEGTATKNPDADEFLRESANAVFLGLLYDQRILAEVAFIGPLKLKQRLGHLDMKKIAKMDREKFAEIFTQKPAVHRFSNKMVDLTQETAQRLVDEYDGDAANIWKEGTNAEVEKRVREFTGFGPLKARKLRMCLYYFGHRDLSEA